MSKPQNPLIKLLQQLGLARFLGLEPTERQHNQVEAETPTAAAPKEEAPSSQATTVSIEEASDAVASSNGVEEAVPEDSVLKRHYLAAQQAAVEAPDVAETSELDPLEAESVTITEQVVDKAPVLEEVAPVSEIKTCANHIVLPQDSVLKRHFLQCLTAEIEAGLSPSPTDSVLRRHHDALVQSELQKRLAH